MAKIVPYANVEAGHDRADGARFHRSRFIRDEDVPHLGGAESIEQLDVERPLPSLVQLYG